MITEIEIEGVGTYRLPNMWQEARIRRIANKDNRAIAPYAFGIGMTLQQFKALPIETQQEVRKAYLALTSPANHPKPVNNVQRQSSDKASR